MSRNLLIVAPTDFGQDSIGGTSAIIEEVLTCMDGVTLSPLLVGATERKRSMGAWSAVLVAGRSYPFLPVSGSIKNGVVPARVALSYGLIRSRAALAAAEADIVYAHCPEAGLALRVLMPRVPIILHIHGTASPLAFSRFHAARHPLIQALYQSSVMRLALRLATRVFVTSDERDFQAFCSTWGKEVARKAIRVPAMVNTTIFAPGRDRVPERTAMGMGESQPLIVSVGRIERTKGCGDAFAAFERLHKSGVRAKYVIVGDGSFRKDLERMVKDADLDNDVVFTGALARNQVAKILGSADLFLSGSWQEGFSVALLEALACGLPAVVTDVGGVRELVEDGVNGYVVKSGDKDALGRALISAVAASGTLRTTSRERALRYATKEIASRVVAEVLACCGVVIEKDADFKSKAL